MESSDQQGDCQQDEKGEGSIVAAVEAAEDGGLEGGVEDGAEGGPLRSPVLHRSDPVVTGSFRSVKA